MDIEIQYAEIQSDHCAVSRVWGIFLNSCLAFLEASVFNLVLGIMTMIFLAMDGNRYLISILQ